MPAIATVEQQIGRAEQGEDTWGPHRSEFHVELEPVGGRDAGNARPTRSATVLAGYPGLQSKVLTFLGDRIGETITGETAPVVVNVFGDDLDALDAKAREVARVLAAVPGAADVQVKSPPGAPPHDHALAPRAPRAARLPAGRRARRGADRLPGQRGRRRRTARTRRRTSS